MRATTRRAGLAIAVLLVLAGCAADPEHPGDGPVADPPPVDAVDEGPDAGVTDDPTEDRGAGPLAFSARALDGGTIDASVHAGSHTVLWMWAPW
jgi:hypothetical protein